MKEADELVLRTKLKADCSPKKLNVPASGRGYGSQNSVNNDSGISRGTQVKVSSPSDETGH